MKRILIWLGIILATQPVFSADTATDNPNIEMLRSDNYLERQKALLDLTSQRETDIRKLMGILEGKFPLEVRLDAARALGTFRAVEAVDVLVNNIALEFQPRMIINGLVSEEELRASSWPVLTALERIGSPAIPALMEHIASGSDAKLMGQYVFILWNIDGYDMAKLRFQAAYQAEQNAERKVRFQNALRQLEEDIIHKRTAHDMARNNLREAIPAYAAKVEKTVIGLQGESPSQSVSNLYYVTDFFNPGPSIEVITPTNRDQVNLEEIMSNRRFRKVCSELGKMDKAVASQLVKTNLTSALQIYSHIYDQNLQQFSQIFKVGYTNSKGLPSVHIAFQISTKPGEESEETLMGEKLKVLSLVLISGMLNMTDNKEEISQALRLALKQKNELSEDVTLAPMFKAKMLHEASLYNRQILASGLLGVTFMDKSMGSNVMAAAGIQWQQEKLVAYDAALTEFDKPAQSRMMTPDRTTGTLTVKYVSPMTDTNFDQLLQALHFK